MLVVWFDVLKDFVFEVMESVLLLDVDVMSWNMWEFLKFGVIFVIDDFGIGYLGFSMLCNL